MTGAKRAAAAAVLSFIVYLTPLVGPHAVWLLGETLYQDFAGLLRARAGRDAAWVATDVAVALLAQLGFGLLVYWFIGGPGWLRGLGVILPVLPAIVVLNYVYQVAIPTRFLIEPDTTPERASWPLACTARDVWVPQIPGPPVVTKDAAAAPLWVAEVHPPLRYGLFAMPGCKVTLLELTQSARGYVTYVVGGRALYTTLVPATGAQSWSVFDAASGKRAPLEVDRGQFPILSTDGRSAAWLRPVVGSTPPIQLEAVVRGVERSREQVVGLDALGRGGIQQLVQLDTEAGELVVARGLRELLRVGMDGRLRGMGPDVQGVDPHPGTVRFVEGGWVAWDGYRENEAYRVAWALSRGKGAHRVPRSRGITSLAVSPDGRFIALSVTSGLSLGSTQDAVSVLSTADGSEVFRKYLPKYTRSSVAFLGPEWFVYTDLGGVNVLRIP